MVLRSAKIDTTPLPLLSHLGCIPIILSNMHLRAPPDDSVDESSKSDNSWIRMDIGVNLTRRRGSISNKMPQYNRHLLYRIWYRESRALESICYLRRLQLLHYSVKLGLVPRFGHHNHDGRSLSLLGSHRSKQ